MLLALSAGQKLGLAGIAAAFILFSLAASFLFPRRDPDFPGRALPLFVALSVLFALGMLGGMFFLAREGEAHDAPEQGTVTVGGGLAGAAGGATTSTTETEAHGGEGDGAAGNAEAGAEVYAASGCGGCHTYAAAESSGTVGPNLDQSKPSYEKAVERVTNGGAGMPAFGDQLSDEQIRDVAAYVSSGS